MEYRVALRDETQKTSYQCVEKTFGTNRQNDFSKIHIFSVRNGLLKLLELYVILIHVQSEIVQASFSKYPNGVFFVHSVGTFVL